MSELLDVLVPSRGRPQNLRRLLESVVARSGPGVNVLARVDEDDPTLQGYEELAREYKDGQLYLFVGERNGFVQSMNELASLSLAEHFACLGDDVEVRTDGWDVTMVESLEGELGVAYGSDGLEHLHGPDLPTHVVIPRGIYEKLGWVAMPHLQHLFVDNVWRELGHGLRNFIYNADVDLAHLHPWARLSQSDQTYAEANDPTKREHDRRAFENWRDNGGLAEALAKLNA